MPVKPRRWAPPKKIGGEYIGQVELKRAKAAARYNGLTTVTLGLDRLEALEGLALKLSARPPYREVTIQDVIRAAIDDYVPRKESDLALGAPRPCMTTTVHGKVFCGACGYSWDTDGKRPPCPLKE